MTDLPNHLLPRPAAPAASGDGGKIDVLSDVFRSIHLTAAMFFLVEATAPWRSNAPAASAFARFVLPAGQHLISYHVVTAGACWGGIRGEAAQRMEAGDILIVPHGDPYHLANPPSAEPIAGDDEAIAFFRRMVAGELPEIVEEGGRGSQRTRFICGFLGCEARPFNPVLAALPPVLRLRRALQDPGPLAHLVALAQAELASRRSGSREVLLRLSELLFIAAIRCHAERLAREVDDGRADPLPPAAGWLAGLGDPLVGRVLALLHADPAQAWTLQALAARAGASRSVLTARFAHVVGQPPMRYLAAWRMQLATRMLAEPAAKVRTVAQAVGYESEAAFSRAFTRLVGSNPAAWRDAGRQPAACRRGAMS